MEMTKKEAIELLNERHMTMSMCADKEYCTKQNAAIDMAISALSAQDFTTEGGTVMNDKKILDVTCGSRSIWFNKHHPAAVYMDNRQVFDMCIWKSRDGRSEYTLTVNPDIVADFTDIPFADESFSLVVFDPPHLKQAGETAWIVKKYGKLNDGWPQMLKDGFEECMRVLRPNGVLIFKWSEIQIPAEKVWKAIGQKPLFGHHSGKQSKTFWACFMKGER